jgi:ribosomal silencing factor RsfS
MMEPSVVDKRALLARVNRRLMPQGRRMFRVRGAAEPRWFIVDLKQSTVTHSKDDLLACARRLNAIRPEEEVAVQ